MKVNKIFNNNVVSSFDDNNREIVVLGKGVGFQKKPGDLIDEGTVEKIFRLPNDISTDQKAHFRSLIEEIPYEYIKYANEIVRMASGGLGKKLNKMLCLTLTDHIHFALQRYKEGIYIPNAMFHEIKSFYNKEYLVGLRAVEYLNEQERIELPPDEAAFIALHIVNAEYDYTMNQVQSMPVILNDMLNIVRISLNITFDTDSVVYERFVVHLKYTLRRIFEDACYPDESGELFEEAKRKNPRAFDTAKKIRKFLFEKTGKNIPDEEILYLIIHISRIEKYGVKPTG